jgi:hypothetical protein
MSMIMDALPQKPFWPEPAISAEVPEKLSF